MDAQIKELPVTIKTLTIDGKKLTKQFLQQVPWCEYSFKKDDELGSWDSSAIISCTDEELTHFTFEGTIIGWVNVLVDKESLVDDWLKRNFKPFHGVPYLIVFYNEKNEPCRTYIDSWFYNKLFGTKYPHIYIGA